MIEDGLDTSVCDKHFSQTPLFYAAREGHAECCRLLIENGCNINHLDS